MNPAISRIAERGMTNRSTVLVALVGGLVRWSSILVTKLRVALSPFMGPPPKQRSAYMIGAVISSTCEGFAGACASDWLSSSGMNAPQFALIRGGLTRPSASASFTASGCGVESAFASSA